MSETMIKIKDLTKLYKLYDNPTDRLKESLSLTKKKYHKEHYALKDINFEVKKGETIGIIGTNGAGKSTLLKIITGVLNPTSGIVNVKGKVSALLELGAGFNPEYTGRENIYLNGTMMGYTREEMDKKTDNVIDFADIGDFIDQPVKTYSSGMFARLAFAVAINVEPEILIVDEALSVGDVFFQNKCFRKFDEMQNNGTTILFVSHDMYSIKQMCSKVLWLDRGKQMIYAEKDKACSMYLNEQLKTMNQANGYGENKGNRDNVAKTNNLNNKLRCPELNIEGENVLSEKAKILSFFITDREANKTNQLETGKNYSCHMVGKFYENISNVVFGFVLENNKGMPIISMNTYITDEAKSINVVNGDIIEVVFDIVLPKLSKGEYLISPAIAQGVQDNHVMLTWVHNTNKITINNDGYNLSIIEIESNNTINKYKKVELY
ncbi:MAG TPA: ABC transporter ATP-binding protein [Epulopiscium sp.]|nr:ABC transporter ATP-binding protein [Candidatus Epulonipiscium sp.]